MFSKIRLDINEKYEEKNYLRWIWKGIKLGWNTPTLPDNVIKFQLHPLNWDF